MSFACLSNLDAANLIATTNATFAVVVCATSNSSFPANTLNGTSFYGCGPGPEECEPSRIWADCTASDPGEYYFTWSEEVYGSGAGCGTPTITIGEAGPIVLRDLTAISTGYIEVSAFGGSFSGNASMLWAYDNVSVSDATPLGYFGGDNVTTVPSSCEYLACIPASNDTAAPCEPLSPGAEICFGDSSTCFSMSGGQSLCISTECDWVPGGAAYSGHPNGSYFFPPGCEPFTVCEHITVAAIFPDDNTCLCLPGFQSGALGNCTIEEFSTGVICGVTQYARLTDNATYECVDLTTCSGDELLGPTETSDRVCASPPEVCVGFVNSDGICVTPKAQCTSLQIVTGSKPDGAPICATLSPPCAAHSFEKTPPTPTSDRVCVHYTGINVYAATLSALTPCAIYFISIAIMSYRN